MSSNLSWQNTVHVSAKSHFWENCLSDRVHIFGHQVTGTGLFFSCHNIYIYTVLIPFAEFGPPYLGKATAAAEQYYPARQVHAGSFHFSIIQQTLTWTTGSLTWSFLWVRLHMRVGYTDSESAHHFLLEKTLTNFSCASDGVWTSGLCISSLMLYPVSHLVTPGL